MQETTLKTETTGNQLEQYKKLEQYFCGSTAIIHKVANDKGDIFCLKVYTDDNAEIFPGETYLKESHLLQQDIPYIPKVYEVNKYTEAGKEVHYSIMEYIDGVPLYTYIKTNTYDSIFIKNLADRLYRANDSLLGIDMAHRDISTSNVLVAKDGSCILIDFGQVSKIDTEDLSEKGEEFFNEELNEIIDAPDKINPEDLPVYWRMITLFQIKRVVNDVIIKKNRTTYTDIKTYLKLEYEIRMLANRNKKPAALYNTFVELLKFFRRVNLKMLYFKK